jgi:23S rRNA pseudouridine2605 synthase
VLIYHKPASEVTTRSDPQGRATVFERLPRPHAGRWVVIGRLDVNTTGLLLFTTDGALAHRLMHPSSEIEREYLVRVRGTPDAGVIARLREGMVLEDGPARFISVEPSRDPPVDTDSNSASAGSHSWFRVVLCEGRNREVRRLWQAAGFEVSRLMRIRFASVRLPRDLRPGQWRRMNATEAQSL